jgi:hypothetical protein
VPSEESGYNCGHDAHPTVAPRDISRAAAAGGKSEHSRVERSKIPAAMRAGVERRLEDYPNAATFIENRYAQER